MANVKARIFLLLLFFAIVGLLMIFGWLLELLLSLVKRLVALRAMEAHRKTVLWAARLLWAYAFAVLDIAVIAGFATFSLAPSTQAWPIAGFFSIAGIEMWTVHVSAITFEVHGYGRRNQSDYEKSSKNFHFVSFIL